ncbi:hypothetical protein ADL21_37025 [Streptomyces albus subsp. albus]|nr:hypothetical protein ADL21_37025 [Streptomyces albus subsp. albus]
MPPRRGLPGGAPALGPVGAPALGSMSTALTALTPLPQPLHQQPRRLPPHLALGRGHRRQRCVRQGRHLVVVRDQRQVVGHPYAQFGQPLHHLDRVHVVVHQRRRGLPRGHRRVQFPYGPLESLRVRFGRYGVDHRPRPRHVEGAQRRRVPLAHRERRRAVGAGHQQRRPVPLPHQVTQRQQHAVAVVRTHPVQPGQWPARRHIPLQQDDGCGQLGHPAAVLDRVPGPSPARRHEQPLRPGREQPLGARRVLLGAVVRDPQHEPRPGARCGLVGAPDHIGEVVRGRGRQQTQHAPLANRHAPPGAPPPRPGHRPVHPVQQPLPGQRLDIAPYGDGRDAELVGQVGDAGRAALPYQGQQTVMTLHSTLAHGGSPLAVWWTGDGRSPDPSSPTPTRPGHAPDAHPERARTPLRSG